MGDWNYDARNHEKVDSFNLVRLFDHVEAIDYMATEHGCQEIIDEWERNKGIPFDERFKDIPGYLKDQHCILLKYSWLREYNKVEVENFADYFRHLIRSVLVREIIDGRDRDAWYSEYEILRGYISHANYLPASLINYHAMNGIKERYNYVNAICSVINTWTPESKELYDGLINVKYELYDYSNQFLDEHFASTINAACPNAKVVAGQKTSKAIKKLCSILGLDKDEEWERNYARFADAINPLRIEKNVVVSWNLYDYLTMSQGNSWTSCHDIDSQGCYSSGTLSYALDKSSVVVYMLPDDFADSDQPLWNIPKVKRQMFHIKDDGTAFIQGRLYPDDQTDHGYGCEYGSYESWRHMMQDIIAKAYDLPNLWKNKKGKDSIYCHVETDGTHYQDYHHYNNCNISYLDENEIGVIRIGHDPICPCCGKEHSDTECCTCEDCCEDYVYCDDCERRIRRNSEYTYYIDGEYYCDNCVQYCEYHQEYEHECEDDMTYIEDYGSVCENALDHMLEIGRLTECVLCGAYILTDNAWTYEDDETGEVFEFCSERCRSRFIESRRAERTS